MQIPQEACSAAELAWNNVQLQGEKHDFRGSEWAGATFSPDGRWLFANLQSPGIRFAITGPWESVELWVLESEF